MAANIAEILALSHCVAGLLGGLSRATTMSSRALGRYAADRIHTPRTVRGNLAMISMALFNQLGSSWRQRVGVGGLGSLGPGDGSAGGAKHAQKHRIKQGISEGIYLLRSIQDSQVVRA